MRAIVVGIVFAFGVTPAMSQDRRIYASALGGIDAGARGPVAGTALPTAGGGVGGGGLMGGFRILFRTSAGLSLGPEFRYTAGVIGDRHYNVVRLAGRLAWGF
jgi:hypothetical protein